MITITKTQPDRFLVSESVGQGVTALWSIDNARLEDLPAYLRRSTALDAVDIQYALALLKTQSVVEIDTTAKGVLNG